MKRVLLIDDHPTLRLGLRMALAGGEVEIADEAGTADEGLSKLKNAGPFDAVLLDIDLPGANGLEVLEAIRIQDADIPVAMFSHHKERTIINKALQSGAKGFFSKEDSAATIAVLLQNLIEGRVVLSPAVQSSMYGDDPDSPASSLTERELEVLRLLVHGFKHKEIAERLNIAPRTVDFHRQNLKEKLDAESLADLVRFADRHGIS